MNKFKLLAGVAAIALSVTHAQAASYQDVVRTEDGVVVVNSFDNCVLTKWDSKVNECKGRVKLSERTIYFDFASSALTQDSLGKLNTLVKKLRNADNIVSLKVVGYADEIGDAESNKKLSSRRANAVESYLKSRVKTRFSRSVIRGLGETGSKTYCSDSLSRADKIECLAEDRRVEIEVTYKR